MKVLVATGIFPPEIGGPATYAALLAEELPKRGIEVVVLPFREVRSYPKIIRHIAYMWKVFRLSAKADLIFTQDPVSTGVPVVLAAKLVGKKVVMRVAGDYAWEQACQRFGVTDSIDDFQKKKYGRSVEALRRLQKFSVRKADIVITPSKYFTGLVGGWVDGNGVRTIYNGIRLETDIPNESKYPEKTMISAGRLVPWKGFDNLISSLSKLPGWRLIIAGEGPDRSRLESLICENKVGDRVTLLGQIPRVELFSKIRRSHIFALLSTFESFSFQIVEAMNIGLPVIAGNIGNISEIIENGKDGILIKPDNIEEFVSAVNKIEGNARLALELAENARHKASDFSINRTLDQLVSVFKECAGLPEN